MFSRKHSPRAFQVSELELSQIWVLTDTDVAALAPQVVRDPGRAGHPTLADDASAGRLLLRYCHNYHKNSGSIVKT